jgi:hypothetical protein
VEIEGAHAVDRLIILQNLRGAPEVVTQLGVFRSRTVMPKKSLGALAASLVCLVACSSDTHELTGGRAAPSGGAGGWLVQESASPSVAGAGSSPPRAGSSAAGPAADGGGAEVCDGIDNDGNGIVDDLDAQGDGVCDCLNIATIGEIGPWSNGGNVFKSWLNGRSPLPAKELGDTVLTDEVLAPFQVIVILYAGTTDLYGNSGRMLRAHHEFSADEVAAFSRWLSRGGGVMTTAGYTSDEAKEVANVNRLLAPFAMGYSTSKLDVGGRCEEWLPHPVTEQVMRIVTMDGVQPDGAAGTTLAYDEGRRVVLQVAEAQAGHIIVWGDDWITYDSEWQAVQDQQVERFWLNILKWLSPAKVCQVPISPS